MNSPGQCTAPEIKNGHAIRAGEWERVVQCNSQRSTFRYPKATFFCILSTELFCKDFFTCQTKLQLLCILSTLPVARFQNISELHTSRFTVFYTK